MSGLGDLARQGLRFGTVGLWATGIYLLAAAAAAAAGAHPQLANLVGYGVAAAVSFLGHFHWTFGRRSGHGRALVRFGVVTGAGFLLSAGLMRVAADWLQAPFWLALALVVTVVPGLSWLSGRYWAFR